MSVKYRVEPESKKGNVIEYLCEPADENSKYFRHEIFATSIFKYVKMWLNDPP